MFSSCSLLALSLTIISVNVIHEVYVLKHAKKLKPLKIIKERDIDERKSIPTDLNKDFRHVEFDTVYTLPELFQRKHNRTASLKPLKIIKEDEIPKPKSSKDYFLYNNQRIMFEHVYSVPHLHLYANNKQNKTLATRTIKIIKEEDINPVGSTHDYFTTENIRANFEKVYKVPELLLKNSDKQNQSSKQKTINIIKEEYQLKSNKFDLYDPFSDSHYSTRNQSLLSKYPNISKKERKNKQKIGSSYHEYQTLGTQVNIIGSLAQRTSHAKSKHHSIFNKNRSLYKKINRKENSNLLSIIKKNQNTDWIENLGSLHYGSRYKRNAGKIQPLTKIYKQVIV